MAPARRVIVTGAAGQVGRDLVDVLGGHRPPGGGDFLPDGRAVQPGEFDVVALDRDQLDVTSMDAAESLRALGADVVVNLAAYTAVDRAESERDQCFAINADGVAHLAAGAARGWYHLVTVSTDYVFDGSKGAAYVEDDDTGPLNVYGASKLAGERACDPSTTVVRTSWVMGARGRNVARLVGERARAGESMRFVDDQRGTPTLAADLASGLVAVVRERPGGLWHLANEGSATWFEVAVEATRLAAGRDDLVTPIGTGDLDPPPPARRPVRSDLSTERWRSAGWVAPPPWREGLGRLVAALT